MPAETPTSVRVRSYDVWFGDCYLLTFWYGAKKRHVLIDFGSFAKKRKTEKQMADIAAHIKGECGTDLVAVVATHRHADHINGFTTKDGKASGDIIRALKPKVVLQPWTEKPELAEQSPGPKGIRGFAAADARFVAALGDMERFYTALLQRLESVPKTWRSVKAEMAFIGENGLSNLSAVKNLMTMTPKAGRKYLRYGSAAGLGSLLPGVGVRVLGPPTISQYPDVEAKREQDKEEYWHMMAATADRLAASGHAPFAGRHRLRGLTPGYARWLVRHADALHRQQLLSLVRRMDDYLNNTSLILLFTVGGKKLLFPGDAQIENWEFALAKDNVTTLLKDVDVYKVGHHGSLNATPKKSLWANFSKAGAGKQLVTMLSTLENQHGTVKNKSEVPRTTLVSALKAKSRLLTTRATGSELQTAPNGVAWVEATLETGS